MTSTPYYSFRRDISVTDQ